MVVQKILVLDYRSGIVDSVMKTQLAESIYVKQRLDRADEGKPSWTVVVAGRERSGYFPTRQGAEDEAENFWDTLRTPRRYPHCRRPWCDAPAWGYERGLPGLCRDCGDAKGEIWR
jgi:hypothetical protein